MHRDIINFCVVTKYFFRVLACTGPFIYSSQDRLPDHYICGWPSQAMEEAGVGHRVCETLPRASHTRYRCIRKRRRTVIL